MKPPNCGNERPYCPRGGQPMRHVGEDERTHLFRCEGCGAAHVLTKPEYRAFVMKRRASGLPVTERQQKYF